MTDWAARELTDAIKRLADEQAKTTAALLQALNLLAAVAGQLTRKD